MNDKHFIAKIKEIWTNSALTVSERLVEENIPIPKKHLSVFLCLPQNGEGMSFKKLQLELKISKSSLSDILTKYEAMGLIKKTESLENRSSIIISLTPEAKPIIDKLSSVLEEVSKKFFTNLTEAEIHTFNQCLDKVLINSKKI